MIINKFYVNNCIFFYSIIEITFRFIYICIKKNKKNMDNTKIIKFIQPKKKKIYIYKYIAYLFTYILIY